MKHLAVVFLAATVFATSSFAQAKQTFIGTITDSECGNAGHAHMRMGPTDAECTTACIAFHGSSYVLFDGKNVYVLSDQKKPEAFAGQRVRVVGTLDLKTKTIKMDSIAAAPATARRSSQ